MIPKREPEALKLAKFLRDTQDAQVVKVLKYDIFDWIVCCCEG